MNRPTPSEKAESLSPSCSQKLVSIDESVLIDPRLRMALINVGFAPTGIFRLVVSLREQGAQGQYGPLPPPGRTGRAPVPFSPHKRVHTAIVPGGSLDGGEGFRPPSSLSGWRREPEGPYFSHYI